MAIKICPCTTPDTQARAEHLRTLSPHKLEPVQTCNRVICSFSCNYLKASTAIATADIHLSKKLLYLPTASQSQQPVIIETNRHRKVIGVTEGD